MPLDLYHKVHAGVDGGPARIITAVDVTPGEVADEHLLDRLIKEHEGATGRTVSEVVADTKYGTHANYAALERAGIAAGIPSHAEASQWRAVPRELFVYDPATDRFLCPEVQTLRRQGSTATTRACGGIIYRASPKVCGACPRRIACRGSARARTITRPDDGGLAHRVRADLATTQAKRSIRLWKCRAETAIAELKERHGLRRAPVPRPGQRPHPGLRRGDGLQHQEARPPPRPPAPGHGPGPPGRPPALDHWPPRPPRSRPSHLPPLPAVQPELTSATGRQDAFRTARAPTNAMPRTSLPSHTRSVYCAVPALAAPPWSDISPTSTS
ncbi:MAG: transposase [Chloroflexota bacterium]|nr:transposase [Chloroflexota bacterium]